MVFRQTQVIKMKEIKIVGEIEYQKVEVELSSIKLKIKVNKQ